MALITVAAVGCILASENGFRFVIRCSLLVFDYFLSVGGKDIFEASRHYKNNYFLSSSLSPHLPISLSPHLPIFSCADEVLGRLALAIRLIILICNLRELLLERLEKYEFYFTA